MIPKYRVWDKINNKFVIISDFVLDTDGSIKEIGTEFLDFGNDPSFEHMKLMQSTGFHDKNGKEIFVGDIVIHTQKSINYGDLYHHDYAEVFQQQNGAYRIRGKHIYEMDAFCNRKRLEVVGNIFENVELLGHDSFMTEK